MKSTIHMLYLITYLSLVWKTINKIMILLEIIYLQLHISIVQYRIRNRDRQKTDFCFFPKVSSVDYRLDTG